MTSPADTPEDLPLGPAFQLPDYVAQDPDLVRMYRDWIQNLTAESRGLPMHTVQEFLLERIATKYVIMKFRERNNSWVGVNSEQAFGSHWLDLVKEWNKVLSSGQDKLREAVLRDAETIALEAVQLIENPEDRRRVRLHFKEQFAALSN